MGLHEIIEGPLVYLTFAFLMGAVLVRSVFWGYLLFKKSSIQPKRWRFRLNALIKTVIPAHKILPRKPVYTIPRYGFHLCLFVVPIWFAGHVMLLEESKMNLGYRSIGYSWSNCLTLIILSAILFFCLRRIFLKKVHQASRGVDYIFLLLTALPYLTGYLLANNTMDRIPQYWGFVYTGEILRTLHILCSEVFILGAAFLFFLPRHQ